MKYWLAATLLVAMACSSNSEGEQALTDVDITWTQEDTGPSGPANNPPALHKIGNKEVAVGEEWSVTLEADDADGDQLTYSVYGDLPPGAKFFKPEGRLVWSPTEVGGPYFVTLVVSDKKDFDSETVELRAVAEKTQHPPQFELLGDQFLKPGVQFELVVQATDVDGGELYYSVLGALPAGASFDAATHLFRWTPGSADVGTMVRVTFQVSDGSLTDSLEVRLVVEGGANDNLPPVVEAMAASEAIVGQRLQGEVKASDPEGKSLVFSVDEATLPPGAKFSADTHLFQWTPAAEQVGKTYQVRFLVTDGQWTVDTKWSILVKGQASSCSDDEYEANNVPEDAASIQAGSYELSICDTTLSPVDVDWFTLSLTAGQSLEVLVTFEHAQGDLDVALFGASDTETPLVYEPGVTDEEKVLYKATQGGTYYLAVFGVVAGSYSQPYEMVVSISTESVTCQDDAKEPNNTPLKATLLSGSALEGDALTGLVLCPGDMDIYKVALQCGDSLYAAASFDSSAMDIDLALVREDLSEVDTATGSGSYETVGVESVTASGAYLIEVFGVPLATTQGPYQLEVLVESGGTCLPDEMEPNDDKYGALPLMSGDKLTGLNICCDSDWFEIVGTSGKATITITTPASGTLKPKLVKSGGSETVIPCAQGSCTTTVDLSSSTLLLVVDGQYGATYTLALEVKTGTTSGSCEGLCGEESDGCYCDEGCMDYGDCCPDVCEACGVC